MIESVRIDKWLWATRFFKSRQLAQEAINGGKVSLNGVRIKPSRNVQPGDQLQVRKGHFVYHITIDGITDKRVAAKIAQTLYTESEESIAERQTIAYQLQAQSLYTPKTDRRPDKKSRRRLIDIKKS